MRKCNLSLFQRLGKAISLSVERFVTVGETIGEEACLVRGLKDAPGHGHVTRQTVHGVHGVHGVQDSQARKDMLEACRESRHAGKLVEKLAENLAVQVSHHIDHHLHHQHHHHHRNQHHHHDLVALCKSKGSIKRKAEYD